MKSLGVVFAVVILCLGGPASVTLAAQLSPSQLIRLIEASSGSITSYDIVLDVEDAFLVKEEVIGKLTMNGSFGGDTNAPKIRLRPLKPDEKPTLRRYQYRQIFDKGRGRIELLKSDPQEHGWLTVYDLESETRYQAQAAKAIISVPDLQNLNPGRDYRTFYRTIGGFSDIAYTLRDRKALRVEDGLRNGQRCVVAHAPTAVADGAHLGSMGLVITVDPKLNHLPIEVQWAFEANGQLVKNGVTMATKHIQISEGCFAPVEAVTEFFDTDPQSVLFGKPVGRVVAKVDQSRSSWNKPVPKESFIINFPKGTTVIDQLRKVRYITSKANAGNDLDRLVADAHNVVPLQTLPRATESRGRPTYWWIAGGSLLGLGVLSGLVWARRQGRSK